MKLEENEKMENNRNATISDVELEEWEGKELGEYLDELTEFWSGK
jgi:hypothetical protein